MRFVYTFVLPPILVSLPEILFSLSRSGYSSISLINFMEVVGLMDHKCRHLTIFCCSPYNPTRLSTVLYFMFVCRSMQESLIVNCLIIGIDEGHIGATEPDGNTVSVNVWQSIHHSVPRSASTSIFLNGIVWQPMKAAFRVMNPGLSEGHQGTAYHPALRHEPCVSNGSQSPLSHAAARCSRTPIQDLNSFPPEPHTSPDGREQACRRNTARFLEGHRDLVEEYLIKAKLSEISSDTHQLHYIPKHHFIISNYNRASDVCITCVI